MGREEERDGVEEVEVEVEVEGVQEEERASVGRGGAMETTRADGSVEWASIGTALLPSRYG